ncbi:hypothetical protein [Absidia glauca]|uniref:Uncharacterized protein n=2 Tax=Absidia glauca TaxID=4829 RepID=A0A168MIK9_ABSGL|nr:hypothetical protein [Absidia glauca]
MSNNNNINNDNVDDTWEQDFSMEVEVPETKLERCLPEGPATKKERLEHARREMKEAEQQLDDFKESFLRKFPQETTFGGVPASAKEDRKWNLYAATNLVSVLTHSTHNTNKVVSWSDLIDDLKEFISYHYDGRSRSVHRGDWKRRIKSAAKLMGYTLAQQNNYHEAWDEVEKSLDVKKPQKISTRSSDSNYKFTGDEKSRVLCQYDIVPLEHKWTLSTGTVVDDKMKQLVTDSIYEHPVHSMIIDPSDPVWKTYFSDIELHEIKYQEPKSLRQLPQELIEYLELYDKKWNTAADLYKAYKNQDIRAKLGERCGVAVALGRNRDRSLEAMEKRARKAMRANVDIIFKIGGDELGTREVGKDKVVIADDKYLNDGLTKLPKTLRDVLAILMQKNPARVNQLTSIGYLIMGLSMDLVTMDVPVGHTIARVSKTIKLEFPSLLTTIALDLLPLLEAIWKGRDAMRSTVDILNDRKRKAVESDASVDHSTCDIKANLVGALQFGDMAMTAKGIRAILAKYGAVPAEKIVDPEQQKKKTIYRTQATAALSSDEDDDDDDRGYYQVRICW